MRRMQIQFTEDQSQSLKRRSAETGRSIADLVRECVVSQLGDSDRRHRIERAKQASGKFSSGLRDVSRNHDKYLAEDFAK
jgi:hypothetical protein